MTQHTIDVVIPAFNEAANIEPVLRDALAIFDERGVKARLVLVDDGSTDQTLSIMRRLATGAANVTVIAHGARGGLGRALKTGFRAATAEYVTWIPADGEIDARHVTDLLHEMKDADFISSHCEQDEALRHLGNPLTRRMLSFGMRVMVYLAFGFDTRPHSGPWIIRREILKTARLDSDTGAVNLEIIGHCRRSGCAMAHTTVRSNNRLSGESKVANLSTALRVFRELFVAALRLRRWR